jgi:spore germination protein GerM
VGAPATLDAQVRAAVQALIAWDGADTTSPVPPDARLREAWVSPAGIAYLDFYRGFYDFGGGGSLGELHAVYGVVATVTQSFPEVAAVQFLIEGEQVDERHGHVDLSQPLRPSSEWVVLDAPRRQPMQPSDEG